MNIKPIPNFPNYFISDEGVVYSKQKRFNQTKPKTLRILSWHLCAGYKKVCLHKNGAGHKRFIHRLVLKVFIGLPLKYQQCRHLDGNRLNNSLSNLKWGTRRENQGDRVRHGTDNRGSKNALCKLREADVLRIRVLGKSYNRNIRIRDRGGNYKEIAKMFNISATGVGKIVRGETWGWL